MFLHVLGFQQRRGEELCLADNAVIRDAASPCRFASPTWPMRAAPASMPGSRETRLTRLTRARVSAPMLTVPGLATTVPAPPKYMHQHPSRHAVTQKKKRAGIPSAARSLVVVVAVLLGPHVHPRGAPQAPSTVLPLRPPPVVIIFAHHHRLASCAGEPVSLASAASAESSRRRDRCAHPRRRPQ